MHETPFSISLWSKPQVRSSNFADRLSITVTLSEIELVEVRPVWGSHISTVGCSVPSKSVFELAVVDSPRFALGKQVNNTYVVFFLI